MTRLFDLFKAFVSIESSHIGERGWRILGFNDDVWLAENPFDLVSSRYSQVQVFEGRINNICVLFFIVKKYIELLLWGLNL